MFISKLRLLTSVYQRGNVVQESIRQSKIILPTIVHSVRTYSRFIDDDDDDMPARKTSVTRSQPSGQRFGNRQNFGRPEFGERKSNWQNFGKSEFGQRNSSGSRRESFNDGLQKLRPIRYETDELSAINKEFYKPSELTRNRTETEIEEFRTKHEITVPRDAPRPILTFNELENLPENVAKEIQKQSYNECTPIQAQGIPTALSGKNMIGIAQTGYGGFNEFFRVTQFLFAVFLFLLPLDPGKR